MTKAANDLAEGTIVGEWRIGKLLGRGGQGAVWEVRAVGVKHAPPRALKACFAADDKPRARFVREVELLQACASPLVLALLEAHPTWEQWSIRTGVAARETRLASAGGASIPYRS